MQNSGKWLIAFIFGTALAMAIFAWSFQFMRGRRVLELYGADAARLIRVDADRIQLLQLGTSVEGDATSDEPAEFLQLGDRRVPIAETLDISRARGQIHARQALIEDSSYRWDAAPGDCQPQWSYALRFSQGERVTTIAFDMVCQRLRLVESGADASLAKHFVAGMQKFVDEQRHPATEDSAASPR